jgi:hypothetical protein
MGLLNLDSDVIYQHLAAFINIEITFLTPIILEELVRPRRTDPAFRNSPGDQALAGLAAVP